MWPIISRKGLRMSKLIDWILDFMKPFLIKISEARLSLSYPAVKEDFYNYLKKRIKPGMVLLTYEKGAFTNVFNRGHWKHAALYLGSVKIKGNKSKSSQILESTHMGVLPKDLKEFCLSKDRIVLLKPKFCGKNVMLSAVEKSLEWIGWPYDFRFSPFNKAKYCVEVVIDSYLEVFKSFKPSHSKVGGRVIYTPDQLYSDDKNWEVVCSSEMYYRDDN